MEPSKRMSTSKLQRPKSKSPTAGSSKTGSPYRAVQRKRSKSISKGSRVRIGSREKTPSATKPDVGTLGKTKISSVLQDELNRLKRLACIEGDENNNYLEDIETFQTQTIKLEVCPQYRVFQMNGKPITLNSPSKSDAIPEHNDTMVVATKIPSRTFLRNVEDRLKPKLTASFYRCAVSNDEESADRPRLSFQQPTRPKQESVSVRHQDLRDISILEMEAHCISTSTTVSLIDVAAQQGEGGRLGIDYITEMMKQIVPEDLESQIVSGAYELGSHVLNAGWKVATSLMPDESDMEPESDLIKVNGYEIKSVGRGMVIQAIYLNSDRHNAYPPCLDTRSLDPYARLRIWIQLRRNPRPYKGLHGYSNDHEIESQVSVTDTKWILNCGESSLLTITVPTGVCTSNISRIIYPDGSLIVQAP